MNKEKLIINDEINKINSYMKNCLWMDFTLVECYGGSIEMYGAVSQTWNNYKDSYAIKIIFERPFYVSCLLEWTSDNTMPFICLVEGEEECNFNDKLLIERGNYIFKIAVEDFDKSPIYIVAQGVKSEILNENPFQC